jgi:hypothetical protein
MKILNGAVVAIMIALAPIQVWAECAWVLWQESSAVGYAASWAPQGAWPLESQCRLQRNRAYAAFGPVSEVSEGSAIRMPDSTTGATVRLLCLPDTIDPRGPKGGGR